MDVRTEALSTESGEYAFKLNACDTARLFFSSLLIIDAPLGEPCGVGMGVAAVWVMIGGVRTPPWSDGGGAELVSSFVTETDGGRPNIFFSVDNQWRSIYLFKST